MPVCGINSEYRVRAATRILALDDQREVVSESRAGEAHRGRGYRAGVSSAGCRQEVELDWKRPARLLGTVACPTLAVHGEADAAVPASLAQSIVAAMPNARLELIPDGGHRPDIRTPELVNPLLLEFLLDA